MKLLTTSNTKILKSREKGYITFGMHLAPGNLSGYETCFKRSKGCTKACLNLSGHGAMTSVQKSRIKKTKLFFEQRESFLVDLWHEVALAVRYAKKAGMTPCFRLNLTSDLLWESVKYKGLNIMETFPKVQFYDYTKIPLRMRRFLSGQFPANYHLTFSRSEANGKDVESILKLGGNIAVVFRNQLPISYLGLPVVSGNNDDLRFLDPVNCVIGLIEKGPAKKDASGFVVTP
jgi:hypothetical protein